MKNSISPKKSLGQNFLTSQAHLMKIAALCVEPGVEMIEIGPGKGALTKKVLELNDQDKLHAIEIDQRMIPELDNLKEQFANFDYEIEDFLQSKPEVSGKIVFGNLPYCTASKIILSLLNKKAKKLVFLLQKEVVERISASPGTSEYGSLSVLVQAYYTVKKDIKIGPGCFFPAPKVNSQVITMFRKENIETFNHEKLLKLLKLAFQFKRKKLRNGLHKELPMCERYLDIEKRPEEIEVAKYIEICKSMDRIDIS